MDTHPSSRVVHASAERTEQLIPPRAGKPPTSLAKAQALNRQTRLAALRALGVGLATVRYEGGGDEGNTTETTFATADGQEPNYTGHVDESVVQLWDINPSVPGRRRRFVPQKTPLIDALEAFAFEASSTLHGEWWNGHGGQGEVTFNPGANAILVKHEDFHIDVTLTETLL